jgi:hypothetical protein
MAVMTNLVVADTDTDGDTGLKLRC